jgi:tetratricopeptide (TPR) repeat protein
MALLQTASGYLFLAVRRVAARAVHMQGSLHRNFGNQSSFRREHQAALRCFSRAYALDPGFDRALFDRAVLLWRELGDLEAALADFDALLQENPGNQSALLNRAMALQENGRYQAALTDLEVYLQLPPENQEYAAAAQRTAALLRELLG